MRKSLNNIYRGWITTQLDPIDFLIFKMSMKIADLDRLDLKNRQKDLDEMLTELEKEDTWKSIDRSMVILHSNISVSLACIMCGYRTLLKARMLIAGLDQ